MRSQHYVRYWQDHQKLLISMVVLFLLTRILPPFQLFEDRSPYLLQSHLLLELFAVIVAVLIAIISWYECENSDDLKPRVLLTGFGIVAFLDLIHALTYDGMPALGGESSTQRAIFFWLAGRTFILFTLFLLFPSFKLRLSRWVCLAIAGAISFAMFWVGTFQLDWIPDLYIKGIGVTGIKAFYERILFSFDVLLALVFIAQASDERRDKNFSFASSCLVMAIGELIFANYITPSDFLNIFGHVFKVVAYVLLYQNVFVSAIRQPYKLIRSSEEKFRALTELSADWFWIADAEFRVREISKESRLGSVQLFKNVFPWDLHFLYPVGFDWNELRSCIAERFPFKDYVCQLKISDEIYWISASGTPIYNDREEFVGYRGIASDITSRKKSELQIEFLAFHDALTGLPNRLMLQDRFEQMKSYSIRENKKLALLFLDLDHFKKINDYLGHDVGDFLLKEVALRLQLCMRETDSIARIGGDEFLMIISDIDRSEDIAQVAEEMINELQKTFVVGNYELSTSASIGISLFPDDGEVFEDLRKNADMAMYRAKESGRNFYRFFDDGMNADALNYMTLKNGLAHAIERRELILYYQPQIHAHSRQIIGVEALIRWNHPEMGMVSPGNFIPIAEESGLMIPIGDWVLLEACRQAAEWLKDGVHFSKMAVNLSAVQFRRGDVENSVLKALNQSGLRPEYLELELTESILIQKVDSVLACVRKLKNKGVKFSIDDFGTGYSSLSYLKRFDIDKIKIDQSFVRDVCSDENDVAIVRAIIQMAHGLNLCAIAEGVETKDVFDKLRSLGCDEVQGYFFARPMKASDFVLFQSKYAGQLECSCE